MQRHFYATGDDLRPVLESVERKHSVAYTLTGLLKSGELTTVSSVAAIATLGSPAPDPNACGGYAYLVTPADVQVVIREVPQQAGGIRYAVDQLANPISITLIHGGFYAPDILLHGRVASCSDHAAATKLYRAFAVAIAKNFTRVRGFYVGPKAVELFHLGCRLTIGANSPREYDLAYEHPPKAAE
jgi:hypothetical protein